MKHLLFLIAIIPTLNTVGQIPDKLTNKWGFWGNAIIYFSEINGMLYVDVMGQDTYRFINLYDSGKITNTGFFRPVQIVDTSSYYKFSAILKLNYRFGNGLDTVGFLIDKKNGQKLNVSGKIVYDYREKGISTNKHCDTSALSCSILLYDIGTFEKLKKLKPIEEITNKEMEFFVNQFDKVLKTKCNLCSEDFFVSDINKLVIELGYNPIFNYQKGGQTIYKTSALYELTFLLTIKNKALKKKYDDIISYFYTGKN